MGAIEHAPLFTRHRLTADDYHRMAEIGVLPPDLRVELIDGEIIKMNAIGTPHASTVFRLNRLLTKAVGETAIVAVQSAVRLDRHSEPEPDLMLLRPRADFYFESHPGPADVLLLIEVADSSARYDREIKLPLYARSGVNEVWIVDLDAGVLRFHRDPSGAAYAQVSTSDAQSAGPVPVAALPGVVIDLSAVLPGRTPVPDRSL